MLNFSQIRRESLGKRFCVVTYKTSVWIRRSLMSSAPIVKLWMLAPTHILRANMKSKQPLRFVGKWLSDRVSDLFLPNYTQHWPTDLWKPRRPCLVCLLAAHLLTPTRRTHSSSATLIYALQGKADWKGHGNDYIYSHLFNYGVSFRKVCLLLKILSIHPVFWKRHLLAIKLAKSK